MALSARRHTIYSNSFMEPFDLAVYSSESVNNFDEENSTDDEDEPSFDVSLRLDHGISLGESDNEEDEDGGEEEDHQFCQKSETELGYGIKRICSNKHIAHKWCSQALLNRGLHSGNALISASLVVTGNNFRKLALIVRF